MSRIVNASLSIVFAAVAIAANLLWLLFFLVNHPELGLHEGIGEFTDAAARVSFVVLGSIVVLRRGSFIGWLLVTFSLIATTEAVVSQYLVFDLSVGARLMVGGRDISLEGAESLVPLATAANALTFVPMYLALLLFPDAKLASKRWRPVLIVGLIALAAYAMRITIAPFETHPNPLHVRGSEFLTTQLSVLGNQLEIVFLLALLAIGAAAWSLISRFRRADQEQRQQIKWVVAAGALVGGGYVFWILARLAGLHSNMTIEAVGDLWPRVAWALLPVALGFALFKYRLYDVDLILKNTLLFGALAAFITVGYVGITTLLSRVAGQSLATGFGATLLITGMVAVGFQPLRERAELLAFRAVYGQRADPYAAMAKYSGRVAAMLPSGRGLNSTAELVARAVGGSRGRVEIFRAEAPLTGEWRSNERPATHAAQELVVRLPVAHQGEEVGSLEVATQPGRPLRPEDEELLSNLAAQSAVSFRNLQLIEELKSQVATVKEQKLALADSYRRLITADTEARERFNNEVRRKVISPLSEAAGQLESRDPLPTEPAAENLATSFELAKHALNQLRELGRGLFPAILEGEGLIPALRGEVTRAKSPVAIEIARGFREIRFPQIVETTVFFCCRHAIHLPGASTNTLIRLSHSGESLDFEVSRSSSGVESLVSDVRDRVEALGGRLKVSVSDGRISLRGQISLHVASRKTAPSIQTIGYSALKS